MKITYTAIDGQCFNSEAECLEHEKFLTGKHILILDAIASHVETCTISDEGQKKKKLEAIDRIKDLIGVRGSTRKFFDRATEIVIVLLACAAVDGRLSTIEDAKSIQKLVDDLASYDNLDRLWRIKKDIPMEVLT